MPLGPRVLDGWEGQVAESRLPPDGAIGCRQRARNTWKVPSRFTERTRRPGFLRRMTGEGLEHTRPLADFDLDDDDEEADERGRIGE